MLPIKMSFQLQATVDVCFKIKSFRNLTDSYLRSLYFKLSVNAGNCLGVPYQIISQKENLSSITLLDYISPLVSFGPLAVTELNELVVFRLNVPMLQIEDNNLSYRFMLVQSANASNQRILGDLEIQHTSLLWIGSYTPTVFINNGCGIDVTVQTQLLKFRTRDLKVCPKWLLTAAMELLLVSFNKLKNRISQKTTSQFFHNFQSKLISQIQDSTKHPANTIFQPRQIKLQRQKLIKQAFKLIPSVGNSIQQGWSLYLKKQLQLKVFEEERTAYFNAFSMKVKQLGNHSQANQNDEIVIQSIRKQSLPIIKLVYKQQNKQKFGVKTAHHFVFLVHGYGATSSIMVQFELMLRYLYPHLTVINSRINQNKTEEQIQKMGKRLATEVQIAIHSKKYGDDYSISFISHSLGGLITRSALTFMEQQKYHMKCFISLGTPHLSHLFHNSAVNKFGIWALAALKHSVVMSTLLMQTAEDNYRKAYIYELSSMSGVNWFQEVTFYGSKGDKFVSLQSALCMDNEEIASQKRNFQKKATVWEEMRRNIESQLKGITHAKYEVDFSTHNSKLESTNFTDDWLGRRDHINLCTSQAFVNSLLVLHKDAFK